MGLRANRLIILVDVAFRSDTIALVALKKMSSGAALTSVPRMLPRAAAATLILLRLGPALPPAAVGGRFGRGKAWRPGCGSLSLARGMSQSGREEDE